MNIIIKNKKLIVKPFKYFSGRNGLMLIDYETGKDYMPATLDIENIPILANEVIVKNHDLQYGVLDALTKAKIIDKQHINKTLGVHTVFVCKLKQIDPQN